MAGGAPFALERLDMGILTQFFAQSFHPSQEPPKWLNAFAAWATASGLNVTPETALGVTAVFACIRVLAESVASLPLAVFRRLPDGRSKAKATDHYLYRLLHDQPNPEMTSFEFRETLMGHLGGWGNAYADIEVDGNGRVAALWPLLPNKMEKITRENGELIYHYRVPDSVGGRVRQLRGEFVFHLRGLGADGLVGYSPIKLHCQAIGLTQAAEQFGATFFKNNARPAAVLEHPGQLGDKAQENLRTSWEAIHSGLENAHRLAILEEGMKMHEVGIPPDDAQFLQTRKFQIPEIGRMYRMQPHKIQDLEHATFSNIEHQSIEFVVDTLRPWLVRWEQRIHSDLLLPRERDEFFAEFNVDGLLRGDIASRYGAYSVGRNGGWLSVNDIRERENMNPISGGDVYLQPLNMAPLAQAGAETEALAREIVAYLNRNRTPQAEGNGHHV
jgi:HK97 family phage portal protein